MTETKLDVTFDPVRPDDKQVYELLLLGKDAFFDHTEVSYTGCPKFIFQLPSKWEPTPGSAVSQFSWEIPVQVATSSAPATVSLIHFSFSRC